MDGQVRGEVVQPGPAFYFDLLYNVNTSMGTSHSPGPRAGAALTGFAPTANDAILFGGLTAVNKSADNPVGERAMGLWLLLLRGRGRGRGRSRARLQAGVAFLLTCKRLQVAAPFSSQGCCAGSAL